MIEAPESIRCTCGKLTRGGGQHWGTVDGHALDCPRSTSYYHTAKEAVDSSDLVTKPPHYQFFPDVEAIEIIASSMSVAGFHGYCMGNRLKYRLRAGNKDKLEQDIAKSDYYVELFNKHKHLCRDFL